MKKMMTILLALMMLLCLAACGDSTGKSEDAEGNAPESSTDKVVQLEGNAEDGVQTERSEDGAQTEDSDTQTEAESTGHTESANADGTEDAGSSEEQQPEAEMPEAQGGKVLVAYFSATGTT